LRRTSKVFGSFPRKPLSEISKLLPALLAEQFREEGGSLGCCGHIT
jgi:hypothetical protein